MIRGAKKCTSALTPWVDATTSWTWWMEQLSITTMEWGFLPSKGIKCGIRCVWTKLYKASPLAVPLTVLTSKRPVQDMQAIAETLSALTSSSWLLGVSPHRLYPYFNSVLRLSTPVSSTKIIISLEYTDTSEVYCSLRNLSYCNATLCNFFRVNPFSCKNLQMVDLLSPVS